MDFTYYSAGASAGYLESVTNAAGETVRYAYDLAGRVNTMTRADGAVIKYAYDADGNLSSVTPANRTAHRYGINTVQDVSEYIPPDVAGAPKTSYAYDLDREPKSITRPDGQLIAMKYDTRRRVSEIVADTDKRAYTYDDVGRVATVSAPTSVGGTVTTLNRTDKLLTGIAQDSTGIAGLSATLTVAYNPDLLIIRRSVTRGASGVTPIPAPVARPTVNYSYNDDRRLTQSGPLTYVRTGPMGSVSAILDNLPNTTSTAIDVSPLGELTQLAHNVTPATGTTTGTGAGESLKFSYRRDKVGRIIEKTETRIRRGDPDVQSSTFNYQYDLAGRLIETQFNGTKIGAYSYDGNGNRVSESVSTASANATPRTATTDAQDRLLTCGAREFTYDADGRLTQKRCTTGTNPRVQTYAYNKLGELTTLTTASGKRIDYLYDGMGKRIGRKLNGVLTHGFIYESTLRPAAQMDASGAITHEFIYGEKVNVPDALILPAGSARNATALDKTYRLLHDHLGSVRLVIDSETGNVVQELEYDTWGVVITDTNPGFQPFGFAGGLYDPDAKLIRFGARDYDPQEGRWTTKDPKGLAGGLNLYQYANSDPVNVYDPEGQSPMTCPPFSTPYWIDIYTAAQASWQAAFMMAQQDKMRPGPDADNRTAAEHYLFARGFMDENDRQFVAGALLGPLAAIEYQHFKLFGLYPNASPASLEQLKWELKGMFDAAKEKGLGPRGGTAFCQ